MEPWHLDDQATIYHGDCLEVLRELPDASVDSVVTDPPYGLEFMGKEWDSFKGEAWRTGAGMSKTGLGERPTQWVSYGRGDSANATCAVCGGRMRGAKQHPTADSGPHDPEWRVKGKPLSERNNDAAQMRAFGQWCELWAAECLRVLKPGGHLLAFGGTRTWHRLAVAIEDAGFEIRDSIAWMYGSGFPKSLDVSKAIDKQRDDRADILRVTAEIARLRDEAGLTNRDLDDAFGFAGMAGHWTSTKSQPAVPRVEQWAILRDMLNPDPWLDHEVWRLNGRKGEPGEAWKCATVIGIDERWNEPSGIVNVNQGVREKIQRQVKSPATPDAARWQGWGTALKPAHEPVVVARKPLTGTVAGNVLEHGTGALNIDGCRIAATDSFGGGAKGTSGFAQGYAGDGWQPGSSAGRWPANVVLDEDQAAALDKQSGYQKDGVATNRNRRPETEQIGWIGATMSRAGQPDMTYGGGGGASRFFYVAKAPARERPKVDGVAHPTVKPLTLMRWLCRLVTPPGGVVLEPFAGSGTTIEAALMESFRVVAIEREPDYLPLIAARLERVAQEPDDGQLTFDASA